MARKKTKKAWTKPGDAEIKARVAPAKANPSTPKRKFSSQYGEARRNYGADGITLTAIRKQINEPIYKLVPPETGADGNMPTSEATTVAVKPPRCMRLLRRQMFVNGGLLPPLPSDTERRKTRRRNNRYAAVGTKGTKPPKKSWHRAGGKKPDAAAPPKMKKAA